MRNRGWRWALLIAGLLVAFALRVHRLGDQNVWWDEGLAIWAVRHGFLETTTWTAGDVHPPLYFWLLWPWVRLTGESEFAARSITVLVALLTVATMAPLGRRLGGKAAGVGALYLLALSRFHVWWSQEMRMYALAALCATLSFYFLARAVTSHSRRDRAAWIGATVAALYTIYFSALLLLVQNLFVLLAGIRRRDRWALGGRWALDQGIALALFAPWLAFAVPRMRSWSVVEEPVPLGFVFQLNGVLLTTGISTFVERYGGIALAVGFVILWGVAALLRHRAPKGRLSLPDGLTLLFLGTLLPPVMVWLVTQPRAIFYSPRVEARYFLSFAPLFYALLAWALAALWTPRRLRPLGLVACAGVMAVALWALPGHYADRRLRDDLQTIVQAIRAQAQPGDAVVLVSGDRAPLFLYYYDRAPAPADRPPVYPIPRRSPILDASGAETELAPVTENHTRIWLAEVERHLQDPEGAAEEWLAGRYARLLTLTFGYNRLSLFGSAEAGAAVPATEMPRYPVGARGDDLEFPGYDLAVREVRPQDPLRVGLYLRALRPLTPTVALVGPEGDVWWTELALTPLPHPTWRMVEVPVLGCYPSGRYRFELRVPGHAPVQFGQVRVTHTRPAPDVSRIPHPMEAGVGEHIRFLGYGLYRKWGPFWRPVAPGEAVRPGEHLRLDLYWAADGPVMEDYTVFTHLVGSAFNPATGGPVWAQHDQPPMGGLCPTPSWRPGSPIRDEYPLRIAPDAPAGEYLLEVGMYRPDNGERLPVSGDGADPLARRLVLTPVQVKP